MTKIELKKYKWVSWEVGYDNKRTKIHKAKVSMCAGIITLCGLNTYYTSALRHEGNRIRSKTKADSSYQRCMHCERIQNNIRERKQKGNNGRSARF